MKKTKQRRPNNDGCIYKRKNGLYAGYVQLGIDENGKRKRKYFYGHDKEEVENKIAELSGKVSSLKLQSFQNSFCDLMKEWLLVFKKNEVTSRGFDTIMRNYNLHIYPYLKNTNIIDIDTVVIKKLLNTIYAKNQSIEVQKKVKSLLKQFFDYAVEEKLVQYNPVLSVKTRIKIKKDLSLDKNRNYKAIKPEHREKFLEALSQNSFLKTLCSVGYYMGLRIGEILALKWEDFDLEKGTANIYKGVTVDVEFDKDGKVKSRKTIVSSPKTDASISMLPIPNVLVSILQEWLEIQKEKSEKKGIELAGKDNYVFCNDKGQVRTYYGTRSIYKRFLKNNNFDTKEFHFHALRHTFGTILKDNEENLYIIQMLLRHRYAKTTERYLSMDTTKVLSYKSKLDDAFKSIN